MQAYEVAKASAESELRFYSIAASPLSNMLLIQRLKKLGRRSGISVKILAEAAADDVGSFVGR